MRFQPYGRSSPVHDERGRSGGWVVELQKSAMVLIEIDGPVHR